MLKLPKSLPRSSVLILLGFISLVSLYIPRSIISAENTPSLSFSESIKNTSISEEFSVNIIINTGGQNAFGVGAKIVYDPNIIEVVSIKTGTIFGDYPAASFDNESGTISISGIASSSKSAFNGIGQVATITFRAVSEGETTVNFIYIPGNTRDSNIAVSHGSGDILSLVENLSVTIQPSSPGGATANVTSETQQLESKPLSFFDKILQFFGLYSEPELIREGRLLSRILDEYESIPLQAPITDPSQLQPPSSAELVQAERRPSIIVVTVIILAVVLTGFIILIKRLRSKNKNENAMVYQEVETDKSKTIENE